MAEIELEEAFTGIAARVPVEVAVPCERCDATGADPGTSSRACSTCGGAGAVRTVSQNIFGQFVQQRTCPDCGGSGEVLEQPCADCSGDGRLLVRRELDVDIPAGIHDGQQIRVRGEGHAGFRSTERGNAFVVVRVRPDERFVRDGDDLHTALRLTMTEAALGHDRTVPSLSGELELEVPPGTQPGDVRVIAGEGMPALGGSRRGALYVRLDVAVPTALDDEQRRLLEDVDRTLGPEAYVPKPDEGRRLLPPTQERAALSDLRRVAVRVPAAEAEIAWQSCSNAFPAGSRSTRRRPHRARGLHRRGRRGGAPTGVLRRHGERVEPGWEDRWRAFHRPCHAGGLWIGPPWIDPPAGETAVVVDPGRAFGTGAHPTTRASIDMLARLDRGSLLDAGCGSGVVSVAAARLGFAPVTAVDVDEVAVEVARDTATPTMWTSTSSERTSC